MAYWCCHDDLCILQLKVVIQLAVSGQLTAVQTQGAELSLPVIVPLTAECLHWSHWGRDRERAVGELIGREIEEGEKEREEERKTEGKERVLAIDYLCC